MDAQSRCAGSQADQKRRGNIYESTICGHLLYKSAQELTIDYATFIPAPLDFECWCKTPLCRADSNGFLPKDEYKLKWFVATVVHSEIFLCRFQDRYGPGENYSPHVKSLIARQTAGSEPAAATAAP